MMKKQKRLLYFGAHPDDETFGMGSTLAQYAAAGAQVYCVVSTRGEAGTVDPELLKGYPSIGDRRWAELKAAAEILGLTEIRWLGYRDSGMRGTKDNQHPKALAMAPLEDVAAKIVKIIRELKPDVVVTHDAGGGYGHPDHIATHNGAVAAFYAAADPAQYKEAGPPFQPSKLYFGVRPRGLMRMAVRLMPLFGQDPHHAGRNRDIDFTKTMGVDYPVHAVIRLKKQSVMIRNKAAACHSSQGGGMPARWGPFRIIRFVDRFRGPRDYFMREYPPPTKKPEKDLFERLS